VILSNINEKFVLLPQREMRMSQLIAVNFNGNERQVLEECIHYFVYRNDSFQRVGETATLRDVKINRIQLVFEKILSILLIVNRLFFKHLRHAISDETHFYDVKIFHSIFRNYLGLKYEGKGSRNASI